MEKTRFNSSSSSSKFREQKPNPNPNPNPNLKVPNTITKKKTVQRIVTIGSNGKTTVSTPVIKTEKHLLRTVPGDITYKIPFNNSESTKNSGKRQNSTNSISNYKRELANMTRINMPETNMKNIESFVKTTLGEKVNNSIPKIQTKKAALEYARQYAQKYISEKVNKQIINRELKEGKGKDYNITKIIRPQFLEIIKQNQKHSLRKNYEKQKNYRQSVEDKIRKEINEKINSKMNNKLSSYKNTRTPSNIYSKE